jgi:hypothetical protein
MATLDRFVKVLQLARLLLLWFHAANFGAFGRSLTFLLQNAVLGC